MKKRDKGNQQKKETQRHRHLRSQGGGEVRIVLLLKRDKKRTSNEKAEGGKEGECGGGGALHQAGDRVYGGSDRMVGMLVRLKARSKKPRY